MQSRETISAQFESAPIFKALATQSLSLDLVKDQLRANCDALTDLAMKAKQTPDEENLDSLLGQMTAVRAQIHTLRRYIHAVL